MVYWALEEVEEEQRIEADGGELEAVLAHADTEIHMKEFEDAAVKGRP